MDDDNESPSFWEIAIAALVIFGFGLLAFSVVSIGMSF